MSRRSIQQAAAAAEKTRQLALAEAKRTTTRKEATPDPRASVLKPPTPSGGTATPTPPSSAPTTTSKTGLPVASVDAGGGQTNTSMFLDIVNSLPAGQRAAYLSSLADFNKLSADEQKKYLDAFQTTAAHVVDIETQQKKKRLQQDLEFNVADIETQKVNLQQNYNQMIQQLDLNKGREIAKTNEAAAKAMQNVTNYAFVTGVAGSGIFSRRSFYVRESRQTNVEDTNITYNQKKSSFDLQKAQKEQGLDTELARLYQLNERDVQDIDQAAKVGESSLFLDLVGSDIAGKNQANQAAINAGLGTSSPEADFTAGGTDTQRKERYQAQLKKAADDARRAELTRTYQTQERSADRYVELYNLQQVAQMLGRNAEADALTTELQRLRPSIDAYFGRAASGPTQEEKTLGISGTSFFGNNGVPGVQWYLDRRFEGLLGDLGEMYGGQPGRANLQSYFKKNLPTYQMFMQ